LLESPKRAYFKITPLGSETLNEKKPERITAQFLTQFPLFREFRNTSQEQGEQEEQDAESFLLQTPQELLEDSYQKIKKDLSQELLEFIKQSCSPRFFERLVVDLLLAMGYGGSQREAGRAIGHSGDGGIDGIIKEDKLGLNVIYLQAKRWQNNIGAPEIRNFVGSLAAQNVNKGVFIITSSFTQQALQYVREIPYKIILIDGEMLTQLMIEYNVGVSKEISYDIKKIDSDYFLEE
jgi:restriction system protein